MATSAIVNMPGYKTQALVPLKLPDEGSGLRLIDDPDLKLSSVPGFIFDWTDRESRRGSFDL